MGTMPVVVQEVLGQNLLEVAVPKYEKAVQALSTDGPHETFCERVRTWGLDWRLDDPDAFSVEDLVETSTELRVPVPDHELGCPGPLGKGSAQVAGLLGDPLPHRVGGDAGEVYASGVDLNEEQHVEATQEDGVDGEEVAGQHGRCLCSEELRPGWPRTSRRRSDAMPTQRGPHARGREPDAHGGELPVDATISPGRVLFGEAKDQ